MLNIADRLCRFIRNESPNPWGLFRTGFHDPVRDVWADNICEPDDFGDFAPFMVWHDMASGGRKNTEWSAHQLGLIKERLKQPCGLYYPLSDGSRRVSQSRLFPAYPQGHMDAVLGVNMIHRMTGKKGFLEENGSLCDGILGFITGRGFVHSAAIPALHVPWPKRGFMFFRPQVSGILMEELANLYDISREEKHLDGAMRIARGWCSTKSFRKHSLFPDKILPIFNREGGTATISKMNTNMLYGLIRLYEVSKSSEIKSMALKSLGGIGRYRKDDGTYMRGFDLRKGTICDRESTVIENHMATGAMLDAYEAFKDRAFLEAAEHWAEKWMGTQSPMGFFPRMGRKRNHCDIDSHADIIVVMSRLRMLTNRRKYTDPIGSGMEAMGGFITGDTMFNTVDSDTGNPIIKENRIKFLGGALKGIMSAYTALKGKEKIDKMTLKLLMRDR